MRKHRAVSVSVAALAVVFLAGVVALRSPLHLVQEGPIAVEVEYDSAAFEFRCPINVRLHARGGYPWQHATLLNGLYSAQGSASRVVLSQQEIVDWFGSDRVRWGETILAPRELQPTRSAGGEIVIRYRLGSGETRSARWHFFCTLSPDDSAHYADRVWHTLWDAIPAQPLPMDTVPRGE